MSKKIILTGASGFIGTALIPKLRERGFALTLVGRDPASFDALIGDGVTACDYEALSGVAEGHDAIVHLAVRNNDQGGDLEAFEQANIRLPEQLVRIAKTAGIGTIVNTATLHATGKPDASNFYAITKAAGERVFDAVASDDLRIAHLRLPAVYGESFKGNLARLNSLPKWLQGFALEVLMCLKPAVHADRIAESVIDALEAGDTPARTVRIVSDNQKGNWVFAGFKWLMDIGFALVILVLLWWLLLLVWIGVKMTSPGPGLFAQTRVGKHGKPFTLYKFRTMQKGTPNVGTHEASVDSVTKIGGLLRRTKIDELPQVFNILLNQMSLVGPRPCLPVQTQLIDERAKRGVLALKGGITGLAQVQNIDMSTPVELAEKDAEYLALRTTLLDLKIVLATARGGGQGDKIKPDTK